MTATIPLARLTFVVRFHAPYHKPLYAGSALRGSFGRMLRKTVCITRQPTCAGCPLHASCAYPRLFEPHHAASTTAPPRVPYILQDLQWGERTFDLERPWRFRQTLIGRHALENVALIVYLWQKIFEDGFSKYRIPARLERVEDQTGQPIYTPENASVSPPRPLSPPDAQSLPDAIALQLTTPWRYYEKNRLITPERFQPEHFFRSLYYRLREVNAAFLEETISIGPHTLPQLTALPMEAELHWQKLFRYSNRQKKTVPISGLMGSLRLPRIPEPLRPLFWLAQWLHIGKNATLGLGALTPVDAFSPSPPLRHTMK